MPEDDDTPADESGGTSAEAAFALVGDELRADILRVLGETPHEGVSFSDLRSRVGAEVDSGRFNYHLKQLVGPFVEKTDAGYTLRPAGLALYRAIKSGAFNREVTLEPFPVGIDCYFCEAPVEAAYTDGAFTLSCPGCGHEYAYTMLPPSAVEGDRESLLDRVDWFNRYRMGMAAHGVCPICVNPMALEFLPGEAVWSEGAERLDVMVHRSCTHCGREQYVTVGLALLDHPAVVSFCYEHGLDLAAVHHWELEWVMTDAHTTVESTEPWRVAVVVDCGDERLEVVVDDSLAVTETTRRLRGE